MRLVFLYGPPGVGELTVGRELARLTGFRLFHNHLTVDLVGAIFPRGAPAFGGLVTRFRREMFAEAAAHGVDLIFTYVYAHPDDEPDVRDLIEPVVSAGGTVHFVQLTCARNVLLERVAEESRRAFKKLNDPVAVGSLLEQMNLTAAVPFGESLQLDTSDLSPAEAAAHIAAHYSLALFTEGTAGESR